MDNSDKVLIDKSSIESIDEIKLVSETLHHPMSESVEKVLTDLNQPIWFTFNGNQFQVRIYNFVISADPLSWSSLRS